MRARCMHGACKVHACRRASDLGVPLKDGPLAPGLIDRSHEDVPILLELAAHAPLLAPLLAALLALLPALLPALPFDGPRLSR